MRTDPMFRAAAMIGLLANPNTLGRYAASAEKHAAKDPAHPFAGRSHPTFADWLAAEAHAHAGAMVAADHEDDR